MEIISPAMTAKGKRQGKLTLEDFELDGQGRVLRVRPEKSRWKRASRTCAFKCYSTQRCAGCPHRDNCPAAAVGRANVAGNTITTV